MKFITTGLLMLLGCTGSVVASEESIWDFDHQLHYIQKQIGEGSYQLTVRRNDKADFDRLSVFVLRHSVALCKKDNPSIELIEGVELFDDRRRMPNYIFPPLKVNIHCTKS